MNKLIVALWALALPGLAYAQSYNDELIKLSREYEDSVIAHNRNLTASDTSFFRFYDIDPKYIVKAVYEPVNGAVPFAATTMHGGPRRILKQIGVVYFNMDGAALTMYVYRHEAMGNPGEQGDMFIPFTDRTNYKETFQGGRYLDVDLSTLKNGMIILDFNQCYNPNTAYKKGYPYIVPPQNNALKIEIKAGEKIFGHKPGY